MERKSSADMPDCPTMMVDCGWNLWLNASKPAVWDSLLLFTSMAISLPFF